MGLKFITVVFDSEVHQNLQVEKIRFKQLGCGCRDPSNSAQNALEYKTAERGKLMQQGYRIIANVGDQWSDLMGGNRGIRSFKLPNPMYYIN